MDKIRSLIQLLKGAPLAILYLITGGVVAIFCAIYFEIPNPKVENNLEKLGYDLQQAKSEKDKADIHVKELENKIGEKDKEIDFLRYIVKTLELRLGEYSKSENPIAVIFLDSSHKQEYSDYLRGEVRFSEEAFEPIYMYAKGLSVKPDGQFEVELRGTGFAPVKLKNGGEIQFARKGKTFYLTVEPVRPFDVPRIKVSVFDRPPKH